MTDKLGGKSPLLVGAMATSDIERSLGPGDDRFARMLRDRFSGRFEADIELLPVLTWHDLLAALDPMSQAGTAWEGLGDRDILVLSLSSALGPDARQDEDPRETDNVVSDVIASLKSMGPHIVVFNVSNLDPSDRSHDYSRTVATTTERARRWNLALLRSSIFAGISIIDVDRIVAETTSTAKVNSFLDYSEDVYEAIAAEFLRVTADIGFYDDRPLLAQVGRGVEE